MTSFEPCIRMDENAFRAHGKNQQPRVGRKPLIDMTNSRKPPAKDKSSVKNNISGLKAPEKGVQPIRVGRKPLGDLTNSKKLLAQEKSASNNCTQTVSTAVKKEQVHPRVGRKPLTDTTNSRKPPAKDKSSVNNNISGFQAPEKVVQPNRVGRKPLGDLANSKKPLAQEKSATNNCTQTVSTAVNKEQIQSCGLGEGFLHNHNECIKAK